MKKSFIILLGILLLSMLLSPPHVVAASPAQPVGVLATKVKDLPAGSPTGSQISWSWNGFTENASGSHLHTTANLTQTLSVDENVTDVSDPAPTTALSKVYALDYDPYIVSAWNETGTLNWYLKLRFNLTLNNHYIMNKTWIYHMNVTVAGNSSLTPDLLDTVDLYNFTGSSWVTIGHLNSTTRTSASNSSFGTITDFINESDSNTMTLRLFLEDSTDTDFTLHIDYIEIQVFYTLWIGVSDWATTQTNSTVTVNDFPQNHTINYWDNVTISTPSGVTGHNFTVYLTPPDASGLTNQTTYVNNTSVSNLVSSGEVSFNITNLVANATGLNFNVPDMVTAEITSIYSTTGTMAYYMGINWQTYTTTILMDNTQTELIAENVAFLLQDLSTTAYAEVHQEAELTLMTLERNGTDITSSLATKSRTAYQTASANIANNTAYEFKVNEALPPVHLINSDGLALSSVTFTGAVNKLLFTASATGSKTIVIYSGTQPDGIYVNGQRLGVSYWTYTGTNLTITYPFSTHQFEITENEPKEDDDDGAATTTKTTVTTAPSFSIEIPPIWTETVLGLPLWTWITLLGIASVTAILYVFRCTLLGICKRK